MTLFGSNTIVHMYGKYMSVPSDTREWNLSGCRISFDI